MKKNLLGACLLCALLAAGILMAPAAYADIVMTGDYDIYDTSSTFNVNDFSTWSSSTEVNIGYDYTGTLTINDKNLTNNLSSLTVGPGYIGAYAGASGTVTVDGAGATFNVTQDLFVGYEGTGILNITNGGTVNPGEKYGITIASQGGSSGTVNVNNSILAVANSEILVGNIGNGILNITNNGTVTTDTDMTIADNALSTSAATVSGSGSSLTIENSTDANNLYVGLGGSGSLTISGGGTVTTNTTGSNAYIGYTNGSNGTVTIDGTGSSWDSHHLYVGEDGTGTLNVTNNGSLESYQTTIGNQSGSDGTVIIDGGTWANDYSITVGSEGDGTLFVGSGGTATNGYTYIGEKSGATGTVNVNGTNSSMSSSGTISLGIENTGGTGRLSVTDGGQVTAGSTVSTGADGVFISVSSTLTVDANSSLSTDEAITNNGTINLVAGAGASAGNNGTQLSFSSITSGSGATIQALGGVLTTTGTSASITVSDAVTNGGAGGATIDTLDLLLNQRGIITDTSNGKSAGAGFLAAATSTVISLTMTDITAGGVYDALEGKISEDGVIFSVWDFSTSVYTESEDTPLYLSLWAADAGDILDLMVWFYSEEGGSGTWISYDAYDLAFDGTYASFTVFEEGIYAVTGTSAVPVPGTLELLSAGLLGLAMLTRRSRKK